VVRARDRPDAVVKRRRYAEPMPVRRFRRERAAKEPAVLIGDPRVEGWETVTTFEDERTAVAWRDQLRQLGVDASCVADHPLDRFGRGDVYLVVPPAQWSRATEIVDNLE
jgi:hypothetical protein